MTDKEREEAIEDIENILILHGIAPGGTDFSNWTDEDFEEFNIEDFLKNR